MQRYNKFSAVRMYVMSMPHWYWVPSSGNLARDDCALPISRSWNLRRSGRFHTLYNRAFRITRDPVAALLSVAELLTYP